MRGGGGGGGGGYYVIFKKIFQKTSILLLSALSTFYNSQADRSQLSCVFGASGREHPRGEYKEDTALGGSYPSLVPTWDGRTDSQFRNFEDLGLPAGDLPGVRREGGGRLWGAGESPSCSQLSSDRPVREDLIALAGEPGLKVDQGDLVKLITLIVNNSLKEIFVNNSLKEPFVNNSLKEPFVNNYLKEPFVNNSLKEPCVNKPLKETVINNEMCDSSCDRIILFPLRYSVHQPDVAITGLVKIYESALFVSDGVFYIGQEYLDLTTILIQEDQFYIKLDRFSTKELSASEFYLSLATPIPNRINGKNSFRLKGSFCENLFIFKHTKAEEHTKNFPPANDNNLNETEVFMRQDVDIDSGKNCENRTENHKVEKKKSKKSKKITENKTFKLSENNKKIDHAEKSDESERTEKDKSTKIFTGELRIPTATIAELIQSDRPIIRNDGWHKVASNGKRAGENLHLTPEVIERDLKKVVNDFLCNHSKMSKSARRALIISLNNLTDGQIKHTVFKELKGIMSQQWQLLGQKSRLIRVPANSKVVGLDKIIAAHKECVDASINIYQHSQDSFVGLRKMSALYAAINTLLDEKNLVGIGKRTYANIKYYKNLCRLISDNKLYIKFLMEQATILWVVECFGREGIELEHSAKLDERFLKPSSNQSERRKDGEEDAASEDIGQSEKEVAEIENHEATDKENLKEKEKISFGNENTASNKANPVPAKASEPAVGTDSSVTASNNDEEKGKKGKKKRPLPHSPAT